MTTDEEPDVHRQEDRNPRPRRAVRPYHRGERRERHQPFNTEEEAKENCTQLNGGEVAEKKLAAAEKKAEEDAKKIAEADQKWRADRSKTAAPKADDNHKPRAHAARAKAHVKRMAERRRHK